jgi:hypothetical protein
MMIAKLALPRRTFLRGLGATLALPMLDAMVPALSGVGDAAVPPRRLGFVYFPNGANMDKWTPALDGADFELSLILKPLEPIRRRLVVVSGLGNDPANAHGDGGGDHSRASAAWLNATHPRKTEGADIRAGTTVDQIAAHSLGGEARLPSLELAIEGADLTGNCGGAGYSCVYTDTISWRSPTTPLPTENNPRVVFEQLFGDGSSAAERRIQRDKDRSILDALLQDVQGLQTKLGRPDRNRVEEYLDAIREVERRIERSEAQSDQHLTLPQPPIGIPYAFDEHCRLMYDLQVLAYQADITRVTTFMLGREVSQRTYAEIGVPDPHHAISHHQDDPEKLAKLAAINTYHVDLFAYFLERLRDTPDGDGSLLDHSMILYGGGISDGNVHSHSSLPVVLAGGAGQFRGGRHLRCSPDTPLANLYVSMLNRIDVRIEQVGDSTGSLDL